MCDHLVQAVVTVVRVIDGHDLHFVELVQSVQPTYILAVRACFSSKTRRVGRAFDREVVGIDDLIAENIGDGHLCGWNGVQTVHRHFVHLAFFIRQLSRSIA